MMERYYIHMFGGPEGENRLETIFEDLKSY